MRRKGSTPRGAKTDEIRPALGSGGGESSAQGRLEGLKQPEGKGTDE